MELKKSKDIYNKQKSFINFSKIKVDKKDHEAQIARIKNLLFKPCKKKYVDNQNEIIKNLKNDLFEKKRK